MADEQHAFLKPPGADAELFPVGEAVKSRRLMASGAIRLALLYRWRTWNYNSIARCLLPTRIRSGEVNLWRRRFRGVNSQSD
jgi:hypothetical protein